MAAHASAGASELRRSGRVFAFTLAGGFAFVALIGMWRGLPLLTKVSLALAALSLLAGLLIPGRLDPVSRGWMAFGEALGRVTTPLMMAIVYYLVLTPTGLIRRLFVRKPDKSPSYWHARPPLPPKSRLERQF